MFITDTTADIGEGGLYLQGSWLSHAEAHSYLIPSPGTYTRLLGPYWDKLSQVRAQKSKLLAESKMHAP